MDSEQKFYQDYERVDTAPPPIFTDNLNSVLAAYKKLTIEEKINFNKILRDKMPHLL